MSRLTHTFADLRAHTRGGLVTYVTAGDPTLSASRDVVLALADAGADVIEIGVPFSDPIADGPVIQRASQAALEGGTTPQSVLEEVPSLDVGIPRENYPVLDSSEKEIGKI